MPRAGAQVARAAAYLMHARGRERHAVPADDDLRRRAGAAPPRSSHCRGSPIVDTARSWRATTIRARCRSRDKTSALIGMGMTERQGGSDVRANTTRADAVGRRRIPADRAQVVFLGADVRRASGAGAGAGGPVVLSAAALDAGRHAQRGAHPAPQGQAGQSLERVVRGRIRRRVGAGCSATRDAACR